MKKFVLSIVIVAVLAVPSLGSAHVSPLSMAQAKSVARAKAWRFPVDGGINAVKISWCVQWSNWRIECRSEGDGSVYEADLDLTWPTFCSQTVDVRKDRYTGRITSRLEPDAICSGAL